MHLANMFADELHSDSNIPWKSRIPMFHIKQKKDDFTYISGKKACSFTQKLRIRI